MIVVEAAPVDAIGIGMRTRLIIGLNPASRAEHMLGRTGAKAIAVHLLARGQQFETSVRDNQVEIARPAAHRTVAIEQIDLVRWQRKAKANRAAMALAGDCLNHMPSRNALLGGSRIGEWTGG